MLGSPGFCVCVCVQCSCIHFTSQQQEGCLFCGASFNISDKILCMFGLDRFFKFIFYLLLLFCNEGSKILKQVAQRDGK